MGEIGSHWTDFFIAEVGATAALAGLVIVAISINLQQILSIGHLPGRAREALSLLFSALIICSLALIPDQGVRLLGDEILGVEFFVLLNSIISQVRSISIKPQKLSWFVGRAIAVLSTCVPTVIGGFLLASGNADGLYWIAPSVLVAIIVSVINTWVLLIEILR
jgi:modulator of FtsH protease